MVWFIKKLILLVLAFWLAYRSEPSKLHLESVTLFHSEKVKKGSNKND